MATISELIGSAIVSRSKDINTFISIVDNNQDAIFTESVSSFMVLFDAYCDYTISVKNYELARTKLIYMFSKIKDLDPTYTMVMTVQKYISFIENKNTTIYALLNDVDLQPIYTYLITNHKIIDFMISWYLLYLCRKHNYFKMTNDSNITITGLYTEFSNITDDDKNKVKVNNIGVYKCFIEIFANICQEINNTDKYNSLIEEYNSL